MAPSSRPALAFNKYLRVLSGEPERPGHLPLSNLRFAPAHYTLHFVTNLGDRLVGRLQAQEKALSDNENRMTRGILGLHAMIWLREHGVTLKEIAGWSADKETGVPALKQLFESYSVQGGPYTEERLTNLLGSMGQALMFDDIAALGDENADLTRLVQKPYFKPWEFASTYADEVGAEITWNVFLMLLPAAELKAGVTLTDFVAQGIGWTRAMQWMGNSGVGRYVVAGAAKFHSWKTELQWGVTLGQQAAGYAVEAAQALGMFVLQVKTLEYAERKGGAPAAILVQALFLLHSADTGLIKEYLKNNPGARVRLRGMAERYDFEARKAMFRIDQRVKEVRAAPPSPGDSGEESKAPRVNFKKRFPS